MEFDVGSNRLDMRMRRQGFALPSCHTVWVDWPNGEHSRRRDSAAPDGSAWIHAYHHWRRLPDAFRRFGRMPNTAAAPCWLSDPAGHFSFSALDLSNFMTS